MGSSAPSAPMYQVPAGQPSFVPNNAGFSSGVNTAIPGNQDIYQLSGSNSPDSVQGQTVQAQLAGYNMTDAAYAAKYPGFLNAQNQYQDFAQNLLGTQTPASMAQGNALMNASGSLLPQGKTAINSGQSYANQAQNLYNSGQYMYGQGTSVIGQGQNTVGQGQNIINQGQGMYGQAQGMYDQGATLAAQSTTAGAQDMSLGQNLINGNQALDPLVQQELMRAGLQGAAGSLGGAAALGGTAGQAAVGRNLGVGAENWINQQRTMGQGLQTTGAGLDSTLAGAASNLSGAGAGMTNAASGAIGAGTGVLNAGTGLIGAGTGLYNAGTGAANAGSGMVSAGAGLMGAGANVFGTGSAGMTAGQGILNSATTNANSTLAVGSSIFQPRTFGLAGADASNIALSNVAGVNNMNQFDYQTKVAAAAQNAQIGASNSGAAAQASAQNTQAAVGTGTAVATTAATVAAMTAMNCAVARECFGDFSSEFYRFRFLIMNLSPKFVKKTYRKHSINFASFIHDRPVLKGFIKALMKAVIVYSPKYSTGLV